MRVSVHQGDIIRVEGVRLPALVVSKDLFNSTNQVIAVPIFPDGEEGALRIPITMSKSKETRFAHCEKVKLLDLRAGTWKHTDRIERPMIIEVTDAVQSIFDYV